LFDRAEVERLAELWQQALRAIHTHAENPDAGGFTPSDLSLVSLSQHHIELLEEEEDDYDDEFDHFGEVDEDDDLPGH
ncbi:hypothetical protein AB0K51_34425, partial [Kitasatospora sp. NPDC049285]|uniref:hypothetical protein n=1 Tax=Kitasatospora sp. NPDC049285 TaxID=3157096 RepID=UPI003445A012